MKTTYHEGADRVISITTRHDGVNHGSVRLMIESGEPMSLAEARQLARKARAIALRMGVKITHIGGKRA